MNIEKEYNRLKKQSKRLTQSVAEGEAVLRMKEAELMEHFGVKTPVELKEKMSAFVGEMSFMRKEVQEALENIKEMLQ